MRRESDEPYVIMVCMNVINSITHWILGAVAMIVIVFANVFPGSPHFIQHVYLCTIGYVLLMAQAILAFSPNNGWTQNMKYQDKKVIHWMMQVTGSILAITGSIIRMVNVSNNFTSPHGILGLIAFIFTCLSLIGGVIGLYSKKTVIIRLLHSGAGSVTLVAAFITLCLGFDKLIFRNWLGDTTANLAIALTVIGLVGTLCSASINSFKRLTQR